MKQHPYLEVSYKPVVIGGMWTVLLEIVRQPLTRPFAVGSFLALQGLVLLPFSFGTGPHGFPNRALLALGVALCIYTLIIVYLFYCKLWLAPDARAARKIPLFVRLGPEGLQLTDNPREQYPPVPWTAISSVESTPAQIAVLARHQPLARIPRRAFPSDEAARAFAEYATSNWEASRVYAEASLPKIGGLDPAVAEGWEHSYTLTGLERHALARQITQESHLMRMGAVVFGLCLGFSLLLAGLPLWGWATLISLPAVAKFGALAFDQWVAARLPPAKTPRALLAAPEGIRLRLGTVEQVILWGEVQKIEFDLLLLVIRTGAKTPWVVPRRLFGTTERLEECVRQAGVWWNRGCGTELPEADGGPVAETDEHNRNGSLNS